MRLLVVASVLIGCATAPRPEPTGGPRGLRASEHLEAARLHDEQARQHESFPNMRGEGPGDVRQPVAMPWYRSWDTAAEQRRMAEEHRARASSLHVEYDQACTGIPPSEAIVSPLRTYGVGGWNTTTGVIVYLSPDAGPPDRLLARMKCHRAAMMLASAGMEDCPLDLPDIAIDARGEPGSITLSIIVRDPKLVPELQRRTAHDLEAGAQLRKQPN